MYEVEQRKLIIISLDTNLDVVDAMWYLAYLNQNIKMEIYVEKWYPCKYKEEL